MSHQPFESYLFSNQTLNDEQQHNLDRHLEACEQCTTLATALNGVEFTLQHTQTPAPLPGFTQRWHNRLEAHRLARQNRKFWLITLSMFFLSSLILIAIGYYHIYYLNWSYELTQAVARVSLFAAQIRKIVNIFSSITNSSRLVLPLTAILIVGFSNAIIILSFIWFKTIIKLYSPIYSKGNQS